MTPLDSTLIGWVAAGVGALAAGLGILRAGFAFGKSVDKAFHALTIQAEAQSQMAAASARQAAALESNARLLPLFEALHEERERLSTTLRVISKELHELREHIAESADFEKS